jgi:hypothetical protein
MGRLGHSQWKGEASKKTAAVAQRKDYGSLGKINNENEYLEDSS